MNHDHDWETLTATTTWRTRYSREAKILIEEEINTTETGQFPKGALGATINIDRNDAIVKSGQLYEERYQAKSDDRPPYKCGFVG